LLELVKLPSSILLPLQNSVHTSGNWAFSCKLVCSIDAHFPDCQQLQFHLSLNLPTFLFWQVLLEITSLLERHQIQLPGVVPRWNNFFLKKYWRTGWKVAREAARESTLEIGEYMPVRSPIIYWYGKCDEMLSQGGYLSLGWWHHYLFFAFLLQIYSDTWGGGTPGELHPKTQGNPNSMRHKLRFN